MNIKKIIAREQPLYTRAGQTTIASAFGGSSAVISRSLCLYQCFLLKSIPLKERKSVLLLKVMQWSPYRDYGTYIIWEGTRAQVWLWRQQTRLPEHQSYTVETVHYPILEEKGMRILRCADGVEAQYWQDGTLLNSHWWQTEPSASEWLKFQRASGQRSSEKMPNVISFDMALKPWKKGDTLDSQQALPTESWAWRVIIFIPVIIATWTITEIALLKQQLDKVEKSQIQLSQQIKPTLLEKTETYQNQQKNQILAALFNKTTQVEYINQFLQALAIKKDLRIVSWVLVDNNLKIVIQSDKLDPSRVVKKIAEIDWVDSINTNSTDKSEQMEINIVIKEP